ncbi:MAG: Ig-like domain-containing protein [Terracidiphilus sp.]|jgi:hypothetical protein
MCKFYSAVLLSLTTIFCLYSTAIAGAQTTLSATAVNFAYIAIDTTSSIHTVTLTNNQSTALVINSLALSGSGEFALDPSTTCPSAGTLAPKASCTIGMTFAPTVLGAASGAVTITDNASNSPQTVTLSGNGLAQTVISATVANFAYIAIDTTSRVGTITLGNNLAVALNITSLTLSGSSEFALDPSTTCPSSGSIPANSSCKIGLTFAPTALGAASGTLTINDSANNSPLTVALHGTGLAQTVLSQAAVNFGYATLNTTGNVSTITFTNNLAVGLNISPAFSNSEFALAAGLTTCPSTVPANSSCKIGLLFTPTALGAQSGTLTVSSSANNSPLTATLNGTGLGSVTLSASALNFGTVVVNDVVVQDITLTNSQAVPLTITSISGFTGGYSLSSANTTCALTPLSVSASSSCVIAVSFTPTAVGAQSGTVTITDNVPSGSQSFSLSGNAIQPVALSPGTANFPSQYVGTTSAAIPVTLTNEQSVPLHISSATISGANSGDFAVTTSCPTAPSALPAGASCTLMLTFAPSGSGSRVATLSITDDAAGSPQTISLIGTGNAPVTVSPASIATFSAPVGATSSSATITVTNGTNVPVHISSVQISGDFVQTSTSCPMAPSALAAGASCTLAVSFAPIIGGVRAGQLQIYDDALTSPQVVSLSGTGTSPLTISPLSLSFGAQSVGASSAPETITLTNHETESESFTLIPAGDFTANSNCAAGVIAANFSCLIYVDFVPSATGTRSGSLAVTNSAPGGSLLTASLAGSGTVTNPPATVAVVSPGAGAAGTTINVVIAGNGWTHFSAASTITFVDTNNNTNPSDIAVTGFTAVSANQINATLLLTGGSSAIYGARNISVATPLTSGGIETALLNSAFVVADPAQAHTITVVTPAFGIQGQTMNVDLTATGANFVQGTTYANFGDGITINSLTITDATDAQANITICNTTPIGYRTITLVTGGEFATSALSTSGNPVFQIGANNAALLSVSPNSAAQGASLAVTLTATGTHFLQDATQVSFTGGILANGITVTSPTTATAQLAVPSGTAVGVQNATVSTGGEIATLNNGFAVIGTVPGLLAVTPSSGQQGQTLNVAITGNAYTSLPVGVYTNFTTSPILAQFDGDITVNSITVSSTSDVIVNITITPTAAVTSFTANLILNPSGAATVFPFIFTVTPTNAQIVSVTPSCVPQGSQLTLAVSGSNTGWMQGTTTAAFYPIAVGSISVNGVTITDASDATLNVAVAANTPAGTYGFSMATGGQVVSSSVSVCAAMPSLTMSPANGMLPSGDVANSFSVSFTGQFTHFSQSDTLAVVSGTGVTLTNFTVNSPSSATATANIASTAVTGSQSITLTTGGEIVSTYFNVTSTSVGLISVSPYQTLQSTTANVEFVGSNTHFTSGATQVLFGPQITLNSVTVNSPTDLIANITTSYAAGGVATPTATGWQTVYINTGAEQLIGGFLVNSPAQPSLVGVVPSSVQQGATESVTIAGSLTNWDGTTQVISGAGVTVSNLVVTSPTTATATIAVSPTAPVGGNSIVMLTGSEIDSGTGFSVTPSAAVIVSVEPAAGCTGNFATYCGVSSGSGTPYVVSQLQTATLNIVGVGTNWMQGETTASFGAGVLTDSVTITSPTTAIIQITVTSSAPIGYAALTIISDGEVVTLQPAIDVEEGLPTLLAISPSGTQQGATLNIEVLGRFTNWGPTTTAAFNQDIAVNSINVIDSNNLIANVTISPNANVDSGSPCGHILTVTTGTEQETGTAGALCVVQGAEAITAVTPNSGVQGTTVTVTITGSATNFIAGVTQANFNDSGMSVGTITVNSPTSVTVPITISSSSTVGYHTVTLTTLGEVASQQLAFTVIFHAASLNAAIPSRAAQGVQNLNVQLVGQASHFSNLSTATFGTGVTVNSVSFMDESDLMANISIDPLSYTGSRTVTVITPQVPCAYMINSANPCPPGATTGSEIISYNAFAIIPGAAIISQIAPATGNEGQEVVFTITGSSTHWAQDATQFWIAGAGSDLVINSVMINSSTSATVDLSISPSANLGPRSIDMVTAGEALTDSSAFVVTGGVPVITYLSPNNAQPGTNSLEVTINGLDTNWDQTDTAINFGPGITVTSYQVENATQIEAVINIGATAQTGYRTVQVQNGTQVLTGIFLVEVPLPPTPYIWYESPSSGTPGQSFTVTFYGANTQWDPDPVSGTVLTGFAPGITLNSFQVINPTTALANITISMSVTASVRNLTLTTNSVSPQEVDSAQFSVATAAPTLSVVDPGSGMQGAQNLTVNIIGEFTNFDGSTAFNFGPGITANGSPTILGPTIATQSISIDQQATLGGSGVIATTDGTATSGAGFSVIASQALISAITPNTASQGNTVTVEVTGQNTHWDGTTTFQFGAGIVVSGTVVNSYTDATLTLVLPALAPLGPTSASAMTAGEIGSITNGFVVQAGTAVLLSSGPSSIPQQGSAVFTILSQGTRWLTNPPTVSYGAGITLTNINVTGDTSITANGYVQPTTNPGYYNLTVSTASEILSLQNAVYISPGPAAINSVSATTAAQGATIAVTINGSNTNWQQGVTQLTFPNVLINSFTVTSPTSISANITVPDNAVTGLVSVTATTLGEVATGVNVFTITQSPAVLLSVAASSGAQGATETITVTGRFTHFASGRTTASFGTGITVNSITVSSITSLRANITVQPTTTLGYRSVTVTTGSEVASFANAFNVTVGLAALTGLNPATAGQGATLAVTISGSNTNWQQGVTQLTFPGILINSFTVTSGTSISANITIPDNAAIGQVSVTATTLGEVATGINVFSIMQSPAVLLSVTASSGAQGSTETVTVTGRFTHFANGAIANFGTGITVNSVAVLSTTSLQANITVQPTTTLGYRSVTVTTGSEVASLANAFSVTVGPAAIANLSPASGTQGTSFNVTVTGSQTNFASGVTTAAFGGGITVTGITVTSALQATVAISIPSSGVMGAYNVTLTTGGETATILGGFTVNGSPLLTALSPPTGNQGTTNLNVSLTGLYTHFVNGSSIANFGAGITVNSTTVSDATDAVANLTISSTAALGSRNVTMTTGSETAAMNGGFSVLAGIPAVVSASPSGAQEGSTANVVIDGAFTNFQQGVSTVNFGSGITVNFVTVSSATQLTANITIASNAPIGSSNIIITTGSQTLTLSNGFSLTAGTSTVTQINPNIGVPNSTVQVTLIGAYTNWGATTKVNVGSGVSITVTQVQVNSTTSLTATLSIAATAGLHPYEVVVTTGSEVESIPGGFTVQPATISPPSLISLSPGANSVGMPINSNIIAVFGQPMNRATITTNSVLLYLTSNQNQGSIAVTGTVNLDATGRVLTFTPSALLAVNSIYYFELTNSITDATGNTFNTYEQPLYTVFTANITPVTVVAANPPASSTVGTNVSVQLEFSTDMNQSTQGGLTVSSGGTAVAGSFSWNSDANCCSWGPGTILTFTPTAPLQSNTTYTVSYGAPLADTTGNALTAGSFTFTTGSGPDNAQNYTSSNVSNYQTGIGTNIAPMVTYSKPVDPIDINTGTLELYNADSGKYLLGTINVAANGLSATFTPAVPLLPNTYYDLHQAWGNYDADGNYLNGIDTYFTTGAGSDLVAPQVASVSPANNAAAVPLNAQVVVHFNSPINPSIVDVIQIVPLGGSAIAGTVTLASDLVTLTFVPTDSLLGNTQYTVEVNGYSDLVGNVGTNFTSTFTTSTSVAPIVVSTGLNAAGSLITTNNTADVHWVVVPTSTTPSESTFSAPGTPQPLLVVGPGDAGWYSGWEANGPNSDWININPNSVTGNTFGVYSTTFNVTGSTANLCLVGGMSIDDNGLLAINGEAIMGNLSDDSSLSPLNINVSSYLVSGTNTLALGWGSTENAYEAFRLQASIQTCGASFTGGLSLTSATPANGASGVVTNTTVTLNFNHALDPATVNSTTLPVTVGWNSNQQVAGSYQVNGSQVIFTADSPFPINTQIWVGACGGPYDMAGDSAGACNTQLTNFTTGGTAIAPTTPFQVIAFTPAANATNVGLRAPVVATFNRSVNPGTINSGDFALFADYSQSPLCSSYSRSQDNSTLSFTCYPLPGSNTMTAILNSNLTDWTGNALANFSSQFITSQNDSSTNGSVISARPGTGSNGISVNSPITIFANLPINSASASAGFQVAQNNVAVLGTVQVLDNGYTLEFTPSSPFTPGALIQWWTTNHLTDATYNLNINTTSGYFYVATNTNSLTPTVQVSSPAAYTNPVALNTIFDIQFNTPLNPATITSTNIYLYDSNTGAPLAGTYSMPQPNEVRIVPASNMNANDYIYVYVTAGVQSATGVAATSTNWWEYTGIAADTTLPVILSAVPYNGAGNIGVNVQPGVVFNKTIDPVSVNSNTFKVTSGGTPLAGSYWFNSNDSRVDFVPNAPLPANTNLVMSFNGVLDQVGHPITFTSNFQTSPGPDLTAPMIVWTSVTSNESIPTNSSITIQFSESMDVTTFSPGSFYIYDTLLGAPVAATLSWNASQSVAYLTPTAPLAAGREYSLNVPNGTDLAGNQVQGEVINFYAEFAAASTAPTVVVFNPLSGSIGLGTNAVVEAQFSAPIDPNTLGGVVLSAGSTTVLTSPLLSAGNTILQLIPQTPLTPNTTYKMTIAGVKDPAGNPVAPVTNSFTTGATYDVSGPSIVSYDPPYNSTVGTNVVPKMIFNKPLNPITVNSSNFQMYLSDTAQWIPLTITPSANGLEVTLQPQIPLLPNTSYYFQVCCSYQDQDGNSGNGATEYFYTGSGAVSTGPTVTVSPVSGATGIPLNAQVIVSVSAPIDVTSWSQSSIQLLNGASTVAGNVSVPNSQTLIFTPASALLGNTTYTVKVTGLTDVDGNVVVASNSTFTTGSAASSGGLIFTSSNIVSGATGVAATQPIILTFSQILDPTTVNSNTLQVMDIWKSGRGIAGTYAVSGNQVTFTPISPYPAGAQIAVGECGGPTDVLGDVFQGGICNSLELVYFTVSLSSPDTTHLTVVSVNPASGATNVRHDLPVSVTFNKSVNPGTTSGYNTQLYAGQDLETNGSVTLSADGRTMTFSVGALNNGQTYTIALPAGGVADESGDMLANNYTSTFTTATNPATGNGSVSNVSPTWNASGVPTDTLLTLYVNRQVNAATLPGNLIVTVNGQVYSGTVQSVASGYEVQFTPSVPIPNGATVQWFLSGSVLDVNGDALDANSSYFYTVAAANPATASPEIVAVSPAYGSTDVPTNAEVDIQYSLPINAATLTANNVYFNGNLAETITQISPTVVRLKTNAAFSPSTYYYECDNTSVLGTNGVAAQGSCWTTTFETTAGPDSTSGTVTVGPPNSSVNVGTNAYIRLQFSKPVDLTTINSTSVAITSGGVSIPGTWSYNYVNSDAVGANFYPVNPLPPSSNVQVSVSGLLDYAGNVFAATTTQFTTAALPDFTSANVTLDFASGQAGVGTNASFTCLSSKPMDPSSITSSGTYVWSFTTNALVPVTYNFASDLLAVTMKPTSALTANSEFYYQCENAVDLTGNGENGNYAYFDTGGGASSTGPTLVAANPPNGFTNAPLNTNNGPWNGTSLGLLFSEPLAENSLSSITLTPSGGSPIPIAVYQEIGDTEVTVQLPYALQPNTTYTYNIAGATDYNGNLITPVASTFTTGSSFDWTNPTVTATTPVNGATGVSDATPGLSVIFSEAMNPVLIDTNHIYLRTHYTQAMVPTTITFSTDHTTAYLTPAAALIAATMYDLVTASPEGWYLTDVAGNPYSNTGVVCTFTSH